MNKIKWRVEIKVKYDLGIGILNVNKFIILNLISNVLIIGMKLLLRIDLKLIFFYIIGGCWCL